jgi:hypothetical protein
MVCRLMIGSSSTRPVGLSVLAGIFFVVATVNFIGAVAFIAGLVGHFDRTFDPGWLPPWMMAEYRALPLWYVVASAIVLWPMKLGLLVGAGLAFLQQKRRGRVLTNLYVVVSLLESAATVAATGADLRMVAAIFPVLLFLLVNKVFAEDLKY